MKEGTIIKPYQPVLEIEEKPIAKQGKMSGAKRVIRCLNCFKDKIVLLNQDMDSRCEYDGLFVDLLNPWYEDGMFIFGNKPPQETRRYVLEQLKSLEI